MAHVRDRPSLRESVEIETPSGNRYRWGDDEDKADNVPSGERFSDTMPGGFAEHDAVLPRKASVDYADLERLSTLTRYDASGGIIWQGRLERAPKVSGDQIAISPSAVGWQAHLEDDKSAREIYRDIDLNHWGPNSQGEVANNSTFASYDGSVLADTTYGAEVALLVAGLRNCKPFVASMYRSPVDLGSIYYSFRSQGVGLAGDANYSEYVGLMSADTYSGGAYDYTGELNAISGSGTLTATDDGRRFANVKWSYGIAGDWVLTYAMFFKLIVYGRHGLTNRGTEPDAGFYDADIIAHAIGRWCPLLTITTESVTAGSFIIPQAAHIEPTTPGEIVRQANRFGLRDWAVWDGLVFWLHDRGARGNKWRARVGESRLEETGPQVDRLWESVIVTYQDVDGSTRTVGPVGSGADTESADLKDDDPENPANKAGITRREMLSMGVSTAAGATEIGRRFLEESARLDSSGRARLVGHVQDDRGVWHPYSHVRAGDTISFVDAADTSYRRIVRTEKSRDERSCSIDLDAPPEGLQALLERLGVVLVPLGL